MKYTSGSRRKAIEYEKDLVKYWKENNIFQKSIDQRSQDNSYVFYDGPPFITGVPHHGTLLSSVLKDVVPRFWTMQGKRVERLWGWDCHGLPAEVFTEKKLGIKDKRDIGKKITLEEYITTCRDNMVQTGNLWEDTIDRIGRWVNFKGAYKTMDKEYMESVWWAFKTLYDKGKIYEGEKVLMYCTRDATPLSKAEIAMDNSYRDDTDPSVYVKFELTSDSSKNLKQKLKIEQEYSMYTVAWTTTPWTLPSNSAIAVNKSIKYSAILYQDEVLIIAKNLVEKVMTDEKHKPLNYEVLSTFGGNELVGLKYSQPFGLQIDDANAFKIWHADFVTDEDGTGIAHESPAYGEEDYQLSKEHDIPWVMSTDENGIFTIGEWIGCNVWDVNKQIAKELLSRGIVLKIDYITHSYPHCYRCDTKLMYRAVPSWFMNIEDQREEMLSQNSNINWFPEHIKHGRFEKTVYSAPDWNLSRDRFWATPLPVWKGVDKKGKESIKVVGSYQELKELSGIELDDYHRPWIDDVTFEIDGIKYTRIDKVMDCWFESGSMPFAQFHYPFENVSTFESSFPADFISEYVGQVRAWFYYLHAVSVGLFGKAPFKNVIMTGSVMGSDGKKLSKSLGNYTDPNIVMDQYSADALRFALLSSPVVAGEDFALVDKDVADVSRKLAMIWNVYDFFTMYAEVDSWEWDGVMDDPSDGCKNVLDIWILAKMHALINDVEKSTKDYDLQRASRLILPFVDDLSNWYVRRSRKRFWKTEDDDDKQNAYKTLHYVMTKLSLVLAPFTPFMAEELYRSLTGKESVHLELWPGSGTVNSMVVDRMDAVRSVVNEGLSQRSRAKLKVRQPLRTLKVSGGVDLGEDSEMYKNIVKEEVNVKSIDWSQEHGGDGFEVSLDTQLDQELIYEGIAREVVRVIQQARKEAELQVDDRIATELKTDSDNIAESVEQFKDYIKSETLSSSLELQNGVEASSRNFEKAVKLNGEEMIIAISVQS